MVCTSSTTPNSNNLILLGSMTAGPSAARKFRAGRRYEFKHGFFAKKRPLPRHDTGHKPLCPVSCTRERRLVQLELLFASLGSGSGQSCQAEGYDLRPGTPLMNGWPKGQ
eukprot:COSAG02_NODE_1412_length_12756_cov_57.891048_18_plen_110_part_00